MNATAEEGFSNRPELPATPPAWLAQLLIRAYPLEDRVPVLKGIPKTMRFAIRRRFGGGSTRRHVAAHRDTRVVAITGSVGKTTTKDLIAEMLAGEGPTLKTHGTSNGLEGLPATLRGIQPHHQFAVVEAGIYASPGEMRWMASLFRPHVAVLTGIGEDHVGAYGSRKAIALEKRALLERLSPGGVAVVNAGDALARHTARGLRCRVVLAGDSDDADVRLRAVRIAWPKGLHVSLEADGQTFEQVVQLHGRHFAPLVAMAVAAARELGVEPRVALARAARLEPAPGRMSVVAGPRGSTLLMDDYKNRISGARAALEALAEIPARRRIAVLGEFQEREFGRDEYGELAALLGRVDHVIAIGPAGPRLARLLDGHPPADVANRVEEAAGILKRELGAGDVALVKGATRQHLQRIQLLLQRAEVGCTVRRCVFHWTCDRCIYLRTGPPASCTEAA